MSQINPFAYTFIQSVQTQRDQAVEKERLLRRQEAAQRALADQEDALEHQVESAEEVQPVQDEGEEKQPNRRPTAHHLESDESEEETTRLDLTA